MPFGPLQLEIVQCREVKSKTVQCTTVQLNTVHFIDLSTVMKSSAVQWEMCRVVQWPEYSAECRVHCGEKITVQSVMQCV